MNFNHSEFRESVVLSNCNQNIFGILHTPTTVSPPYPTVLFFHGLAGHKAGRFRIYVRLATMLAQMGIASLRIDFRGCGDSDGDFTDLTITSQLSDAQLALHWLLDNPYIDNKRIGFFGRSFGGLISILTASSFFSTRSIALWAPVFGGHQWLPLWQTFKIQSAMEENIEALKKMRMVGGQLAGVELFEQLFECDLVSHMDELSHVPMLHIHGEKDTRIHLSHADLYENCRKKAISESCFIKLPNSDHDFSEIEEQKIALKTTAEWFVKTL